LWLLILREAEKGYRLLESPTKEGRLVNVRRLVALDMGLHGSKFILIEFGFGVSVPMILGLSLVLQGIWLLGVYIFTLGINYVPLLFYAVLLRKNHGSVVNMRDPQKGKLNRKYSVQQFLLFVPFFMVGLALAQRFQGTRT
jgi:hypothetical protein